MTEKSDHETIVEILAPEWLELRAPEGREWVLTFCNSLLRRMEAGADLTDRQRHTLRKTWDEMDRTREWVTKCRATPAPLATFEGCMRDMQAAGYALPPHVAYAIRAGLAGESVA